LADWQVSFDEGIPLKPKVYARDREQWRAWLEKKHAGEREAWLVFFKKHVGKPCIGYAEAVEEAICFGWIDGLKKGIDGETYAFRFTPRKPGSKWSPLNTDRYHRMVEAGRMTPAGRAAYEAGKPLGMK